MTEYGVLEYPYSYKLIVYWNINWIFCTGMFSLSKYCVLEYPHWVNIVYWNILPVLNIVYWNIPTYWILYAGVSLLSEYFVLKCRILEYPYCSEYCVLWYPYWLNISCSDILTDWWRRWPRRSGAHVLACLLGFASLFLLGHEFGVVTADWIFALEYSSLFWILFTEIYLMTQSFVLKYP